MIVFGDEAKHNEQGPKKFGWVLAALPVERRANKFGEVGTLIYVSGEEQIYLVPTSFFHPTEEQLVGLSNTQRRKRSYNFEEGDPVSFGVNEAGKVEWISRVNHGPCPILVEDGNLYLRSMIVREKGDRPRLSLWDFSKSPYSFDVRRLQELDPDTPYEIFFRIHLNYGNNALLAEQASSLKLDQFKPTFTLEFDAFGEEDTSEEARQLVEDAPWNVSAHIDMRPGDYEIPVDDENCDDWNDTYYFIPEVWKELKKLYGKSEEGRGTGAGTKEQSGAEQDGASVESWSKWVPTTSSKLR